VLVRRYPSAKDLEKLAKPGNRYAVGHNVYLQVTPQGTKSWLFRYRKAGRARHMGLGPYDLLTLAEARNRGYQARRLLLDGKDPLEEKREAKRAVAPNLAKTMTFKQAALAYIAAREPSWRGDRSRLQWTQSLELYVFPTLGSFSVADIDTPRVLSVLEPIWTRIPESARRVRNRVELILDYATAHGLRQGDNPARWRGLLESLLADQRSNHTIKHLAAMPWKELPAFMSKLRQRPDNGARALELAILTAGRTGEVLGACWEEIDLNAALWIVPPERMKRNREHRVPLSRQAVELLNALPRVGDFAFVARGDGKPSEDTLMRVLARMGVKVTAHGFRSLFRDWAAEATQYPDIVVEQALAHQVGDAVMRAYRRGDLLDQRRRLMQDWADFCDRLHAEGAHE
jgi:integrase